MLLKRSNYNLYNMAHTETDADVLNSIDSTSTNPIPVIYQSGYQTIKDYDRLFGILPAGISQPRRGRWIYEIPVTFLCQYGQGGFTFPEEKGYAHPFASDTRKLFKIGVNFSKKTRNIETWKVVERNL